MMPHESGASREADSQQDAHQEEDEERFGCTLSELDARLHHADWNVRRELLYMVRESAKKGDKRVCDTLCDFYNFFGTTVSIVCVFVCVCVCVHVCVCVYAISSGVPM
jgi:hypothetical protein